MAVGIGKNLSRARLLLAQRAGVLPPGLRIDPRNSVALWRAVSKNLNRDARNQGYANPIPMMRDMATGIIPRPQGGAAPGPALAYINSTLAATAPEPIDRNVAAMRNRFRVAPVDPEIALDETTQPHYRPEPAPPPVDVYPMPRIQPQPSIDFRANLRRFAASRRRPVRRPIGGAEY